MTDDQKSCPLCGGKATTQQHPAARRAHYVMCANCPDFVIWQHDLSTETKDGVLRDEWYARRLRSLLYERSLSGRATPALMFKLSEKYARLANTDRVSVPELLRSWPDSVAEKLDRLLSALAHESKIPGNQCEIPLDDRGQSRFFSSNGRELTFLVTALAEYGRLTKPTRTPGAAVWNVSITAEGWRRIDEVQRETQPHRSPAFVAMWFGGEERREQMRVLFETGILPGIERAGYKGIRADGSEHNEYIMDQIRAMIRRAPFVVADLTNNNNGVYYEAGFGAGLGKPVIYCAPERAAASVHFDVQQINRVVYSDAEDLARRLEQRISGSLGDGPFRGASEDTVQEKGLEE